MVVFEPNWPRQNRQEQLTSVPVVGDKTLESGKTERFIFDNDIARAAVLRRRSPDARNDRVDDNMLVVPDLNLYVVFDGVGMSDGAEAAKLASERMLAKITEMREKMARKVEVVDLPEFVTFMKIVIKSVNQELVMRNRNRGKGNHLFTTMTVTSFVGDEMVTMSIGGSPGLFKPKDGEVEQVTVDSDIMRENLETTAGLPPEINELTGKGVDRIEEVRKAQKNRPPILANRLTHYLGKEVSAEKLRHLPIDVYVRKVDSGDVVLICSDGIIKKVDMSDLQSRLSEVRDKNVEDIAEAIMDIAVTDEGADYHDDKVMALIHKK